MKVKIHSRLIHSANFLQSPVGNGLLFLTFILVLVNHSPSDVPVRVHDYLDHYFVLQVKWNQEIGFLNITQALNGVVNSVPSSALGFNDLDLTNLVFKVLKPATAYVVIDSAMRIIGYLGIYNFIKTFHRTSLLREYYAVFASLTFAFSNHIDTYKPSIMALPWILVLISRLSREKMLSWSTFLYLGVIFFVVQTLNFVYVGFFLILALFFIILRPNLIFQMSRLRYSLIFAYIIFASVVSQIRLIYLLGFTNFESHRESWPNISNGFGFFSSIQNVFNNILDLILRPTDTDSQAHVIMFTLVVVIVVFRKSESVNRLSLTERGVIRRRALYLSLMLLLFYVASSIETVNILRIANFTNLPFHFSRIINLTPVIVSLLFYYLLVLTGDGRNFTVSLKRRVTITVLLLIGSYGFSPMGGEINRYIYLQLAQNEKALLVVQNIYEKNHRTLTTSEIANKLINRSKSNSFRSYYDENEYTELVKSSRIPRSELRVISIGIDPMKAVFNKIYSFDGYVYNYSLDYKKTFRGIISPHLAYSEVERDYFDSWGSRAYVFYDPKETIEQVNWCVAYKLGVRQVITPQNFNLTSRQKVISMTQNMKMHQLAECER